MKALQVATTHNNRVARADLVLFQWALLVHCRINSIMIPWLTNNLLFVVLQNKTTCKRMPSFCVWPTHYTGDMLFFTAIVIIPIIPFIATEVVGAGTTVGLETVGATGFFVGFGTGAAAGFLVADEMGALTGFLVGDATGAAAGFLVGDATGAAAGFLVADETGAAAGFLVGVATGAAAGFLVGEATGPATPTVLQAQSAIKEGKAEQNGTSCGFASKPAC
jgi:hypothetical protein